MQADPRELSLGKLSLGACRELLNNFDQPLVVAVRSVGIGVHAEELLIESAGQNPLISSGGNVAGIGRKGHFKEPRLG